MAAGRGIRPREASKDDFKDNFARAICCALPVFDLVIVDEGHNLKHGFTSRRGGAEPGLGAGLRPPVRAPRSTRFFPGYGPRAKRVLFLSATPIEETYRHIWNQLDVFGLAASFPELRGRDASEEEKKQRGGEVPDSARHDDAGRRRGPDEEPVPSGVAARWRARARRADPGDGRPPAARRGARSEEGRRAAGLREVQYVVSDRDAGLVRELPGDRRGSSEPTTDGAANFDDTEQTDAVTRRLRLADREGIDVRRRESARAPLPEAFRRRDAAPQDGRAGRRLDDGMATGRKALVFVRRVASVKELKRKLDERYDEWLIRHSESALPDNAWSRFDEIVAVLDRTSGGADATGARSQRSRTMPGGLEMRRDRGPRRNGHVLRVVLPGGRAHGRRQRRERSAALHPEGAAYSTFFEDNHVA